MSSPPEIHEIQHTNRRHIPSVNSGTQSQMDSSVSPPEDRLNQQCAGINNIETATSSGASGGSKGKRKDNLQDCGAPSQPNKLKKTLATRSNVWSYFSRLKDNRDKCLCNYCQKEFACPTKSGTSNLQKHIGLCKQYKAWLESQNNEQPILGGDGVVKIAKVSEAVFRQATNELLVGAELPLAFIESAAWRQFCSKMNLYRPHSRRTAQRDIIKMYKERKSTLRKWFLSNNQRVSVTTDIWKCQPTGASYMVVTIHYIDPNWVLKKQIIGFKPVIDHKGQTIATVLLDCLAEWGIKRVFCITVDNATTNTSALRKFESSFSLGSVDAFVLNGEMMHMRCSGHIINLIVKDGLAEVDDSICAIRNAVTYLRSSTNRLKSFELKVESGKMTRGSIPLDVRTRWNSTYLMLKQALKFRVAFEKMLAEDLAYRDYFSELENGEKRLGPPRMHDWDEVERLSRFLVIFYNSTQIVSASTGLNAHECYGEIVTIASNLSGLIVEMDSQLSRKAIEMLKKFEKYWDGLKNINKMLIVATVFDPRKKIQFAKLCFETLHGKDSAEAKEMNESVLLILRSMFTEYSARYNGDETVNSQSSQSQQSQPNSSTSGPEPAIDRMDIFDDGLGYKRIDVRYKEMMIEKGARETHNELETYLRDDVESYEKLRGTEFDILSWWKANSFKFPILSQIAKDVFAMQVSSVASESAFSTSGRIITPSRSCLSHFTIEVLMCTEQWVKQDIKGDSKELTIAQMLAEVEEADLLEREFGDPIDTEE